MGFNFIQFRKIFSTGIKISILTILLAFSQDATAQTILRVDQAATGTGDGSSWANAYPNLQSALDAAALVAPAEVWVKADTYLPTMSTDQTIAFLIKDQVTVYGGFDGSEALLAQRDPSRNISLLSGDIGVSKDSTDNSRSILEVDPNAAADVTIDGVHIAHSFSPSTVNGAISLTSSGSVLNVNDCVFYSNIGHLGAAISSFTSPLSGNDATNTINISRSIFYNNGGGSVLFGRSNTTISDCMFIKNANANAVEVDFGTLNMINSTVVENGVGVRVVSPSATEIKNSIIWDNTFGDIPTSSSQAIVTNSIVGGGYVGTNVLDIDPLFIDAPNLDFRIQHCSPAVDAGDNTLLLASQTADLDGDPRTFNTTVDMGAFENQITPLFFSAVEVTSISCNGVADGIISVNAGGGSFTALPQYSIDGGSFSGNSIFSGIGAGVHTVTVKDDIGCEYSEDVTLVEPGPINLTITNNTNVTCNGANDGTIIGTISGGSGSYDVAIDGSTFDIEVLNGALNLTGLAPGSYMVQARDFGSCLSTSIPITLTEPAAFSSSILGKSDVSCNGGSDGELVIGVSGGTPLYEYSLDGVSFQSSETFTGLIAGGYTVTVKDANGCLSTVTETLTEPAAIVVSISQTDLTCFGDLTGEIVVTASGGMGALTYSVDGINFQTSNTFSGLNGGLYTVVTKDASDCTISNAVTLNQPDPIAISVSSTDVTCFSQEDGSVTMSITGGTGPYDIVLNGISTVATGNAGTYSADELDIGNYIYEITDANGCVRSTAILTISQPDEIQIDIALLEGDSIDVSASGGAGSFEYSLDNSTYQTSGKFKVPRSGEISVYAKDASECVMLKRIRKSDSGDLVLFVDGSASGNGDGLRWGSAFEDLQLAIDSASTIATDSLPVQLWIAVGTYLPTTGTDRSISFSMKNNVELYGGFEGTETMLSQRDFVNNATVLSGNIGSPTDSTDNSLYVVHNSVAPQHSIQRSAILDGFVIQDGYMDVPVWTGGAGMRNNNASPTVRNTVFRQNHNVIASTGRGGALLNAGNSAPLIVGCVFHHNSAIRGGAVAHYTLQPSQTGESIIANSTFYENSSELEGGAVFVSSGYFVSFYNNTFVNNRTISQVAEAKGGGLFYTNNFGGLVPEIANNIFWNNESFNDSQIYIDVVGSINFSTNLIESGFSEGLVLDSDPLFADESNHDYSLQYCSPAVDFGNSSNLPSFITTDALGGNRIANNVLDLGAFEEQTDFKPSFSMPIPINVSCNGGNDGTFFANAAGSFGPFTYSIDGTNFISSSTATGLSAGNYTYFVKDSNGCLDSIDFVIVEPVALSASITNAMDVTCNGDGDGQFMVNAAGGTAPYEYSIDGTTFGSDELFTGLSGDTFSVTVRDANSCEVTESITLNEPGALMVTEDSKTNVSCSGELDGMVSVTVTGGTSPFEYSINNGAFGTSASFSNLAAANYTVEVRDANLCTASTTITISEPDVLAVTVSGSNTSTCLATDGAIEVTATGGTLPYSYVLNGGTAQATGVFSGLGAGTYQIAVTDANGCETSIGQSIDDPVTSMVTSTQVNVSCNGGTDGSVSLTVTGGVSPILYSLDGGSTTQSESTFSGLVAGSYSITVIEDSGCQQSVSITITEPAEISGILASNDPTCFGADSGSISVTASGGTGAFEYSLDGTNFQSDSQFTGLLAGNYTVTTRDENGCEMTSTATLTDPAEMTATTAVVDASCQGGENGTITLAVTNGIAPFSYSLDGGTAQSSNVFDLLNPGSYSLLVEDSNGCQVTLNDVVVGENVTITTSATISDVLCSGESNGAISASATGGTSPYEYSLDGTNFQSSADFTELEAGIYTVTAKDSDGCEGTIEVNLGEPDALELTVVQSGRDFTVAASGGTAPYEYSSDGTTFQSGTSFTDLDPGNYTFRVKDANGCISSSEDFEIALSVADAENGISVYPNPVVDYFTIESLKVKEVEVYDVNGKRQLVDRVNDRVDMSGLSMGMYLIKMKDDNGKIVSVNRILKTN